MTFHEEEVTFGLAVLHTQINLANLCVGKGMPRRHHNTHRVLVKELKEFVGILHNDDDTSLYEFVRHVEKHFPSFSEEYEPVKKHYSVNFSEVVKTFKMEIEKRFRKDTQVQQSFESPGNNHNGKRGRETDDAVNVETSGGSKKRHCGNAKGDPANLINFHCPTCHRTETPLIRRVFGFGTREAPKEVCNACGLYFKRHGTFSPV